MAEDREQRKIDFFERMEKFKQRGNNQQRTAFFQQQSNGFALNKVINQCKTQSAVKQAWLTVDTDGQSYDFAMKTTPVRIAYQSQCNHSSNNAVQRELYQPLPSVVARAIAWTHDQPFAAGQPTGGKPIQCTVKVLQRTAHSPMMLSEKLASGAIWTQHNKIAITDKGWTVEFSYHASNTIRVLSMEYDTLLGDAQIEEINKLNAPVIAVPAAAAAEMKSKKRKVEDSVETELDNYKIAASAAAAAAAPSRPRMQHTEEEDD